MASIQQPNASKSEYKFAIDELMKEVGNKKLPDDYEAKLGVVGQNIFGLKVAATKDAVKNCTQGIIYIADKKDWFGTFLCCPPSVPRYQSGTFFHGGLNDSKGAVVYHGTNKKGEAINCAWVFAWKTRGDGSPNQVHVETGPSYKYPIGQINWDTIEASLDASTDKSYYMNEKTETWAYAQISNGNIANAASIFG